eukprot:XP_011682631.1 PREDICTED: hydroxyacid oxidase 1-like [Strongylocentrotus purpuratus]
MDGGIRTGSDVLKALARGAKAVFVGRPVLWGLACEVIYRFRPRVLADVSSICLSTTLLGTPISSPIGVAPSALHRFAYKEAEIGTAKGTSAAGTVMVQSCFSNTHVAEVSTAVPTGVRWMQMYIFNDRELTRSLIKQAEKAGYSAIVVTVDSPGTGWNIDEFQEKFGNDRLLIYPNLEIGLPGQIEAKKNGDLNLIKYFSSQLNSKLTWNDVRWVREETSLPVVCKGILTARAAKQAADAGVDAIMVSAHGGRQLDGVPAPSTRSYSDQLATIKLTRPSTDQRNGSGGARTSRPQPAVRI